MIIETVNVSKIMKDDPAEVTIKIVGKRRYAARLWFGKVLIRVAMRIMLIKVDFDESEDANTNP